MRLLWILVLLAPAAFAQYRVIEMSFAGVGCAPCVESMPNRAKRIRGVESAEVDAEKGVLKLRLADENRVRIEQIRDLIEQDGTKAVRAEVLVKGEVEGGLLRIAGNPNVLELKGEAATGSVVHGLIENLKPGSGERMRLRVTPRIGG